MNNLKLFTKSFSDIAKEIEVIHQSENSYLVTSPSGISNDISDFSEYGIKSYGNLVGFPPKFIEELSITSPALAKSILTDRATNYFNQHGAAFTAREFMGKISGTVSSKYAFYDDYQVAQVLEKSSIANLPFATGMVTPERLHLRAIDAKRPFKIENDKSELFFCYFINNSMVGGSAFRVCLGIFRLACTNGMILPMKQFVLMRQIHKGTKDIAAEFNSQIAFLENKSDEIKALLNDLSTSDAKIHEMSADYKESYLAKSLNLSKRETVKVLELYTNTYGGRTKWDMVNAISEFARDLKNVDRREYLETRALLVA